MDDLKQQRQRLNALIGKAADGLDHQLVQPLESAMPDAASRASYREGRSDERLRVLALIDDHLHCMDRSAVSTLAMYALRVEVEGKL